ncbi:hypothetical protein CUMW_268420 [Citrus unshiu]|nr:hypothetical protein CUMW_268420 [Citrus unshiu]
MSFIGEAILTASVDLLQSSNNKSRFVMHDLVNDLAQWAAGDIYFTMEYTSEVNKQQSFSKNLRHLSYILGKYDGVKRFEGLYDIQHLRTFLRFAWILGS